MGSVPDGVEVESTRLVLSAYVPGLCAQFTTKY